MANIITLSRIFLAFIAMGLLFYDVKFALFSLILTVLLKIITKFTTTNRTKPDLTFTLPYN